MRASFRSLGNRNYRLYAGGQLVSLTGTWMQRVAQDWLVLRLSGNSGAALGITTGLQFLPLLLLGLYGGVIADRVRKRRLLICTQSLMAVTALALGVLDLAGVVSLVDVYVLAFLLGIVAAVDNPTRQAFVSEIVGPADVVNAVGLNSATFNSARIFGPAVAGVLIDLVGTGWVFILNAASFIGVIAALAAMRVSELYPSPRLERQPGQIREGLRYVRGRADLLVPLALVAIVGTFGFNFQVTLALMDKTVFLRGAGGYGLLSSTLALGCLGGALIGARRRRRPPMRLLVLTCLTFGALELVCGLMPSYATLAVALVPTGVAAIAFSTAANSSLQLGSDPQMRGRVMGLYMIVFAGGTPIGAPIIGWIAQQFGARWSLLLGGALSAAVAVVVGLALVRAVRVRQETPAGVAASPA